ncbi:ABC transporter ATP-binding protein [Paenibacillus xerothermodurans]|uniref:ABC transporter ATP-binding protein n=1 Tax=Paenibacillus xerothermodurans TaxID=1977292 RepID=A0A2W1NE18_PAEXE|nr:ABC transporter ATP-binding protein [Paenibacillus xerothermodurans]PZE21371.1 ABC transporter ATP-binding protein [Paenibacillus xerothermodurans]
MRTGTSVSGLRLKFAGAPSLQFHDLSFAVAPGEKILLLGPSGCGKSTLLQVLTGLIPGAIDVPVRYDHIDIPTSWGYVFQDPDTQFCMPFVDEEMAFVLENLGVPREEMPARIREGLTKAGLALDDAHIPIQSLSQGMKQRLAIASVLALQPDVLFLDEPTALLDPEGTRQVWDTMKNVSADKTVLIVEHKIDKVIDFVDRVVLFTYDGTILADGDPNRVFADYAAALREYGIWYPGVWDDYAAGAPQLTARISGQISSSGEHESSGQELCVLQRFDGYPYRSRQPNPYRSRQPKIHIEDARVGSGEWIAVVGDNGAGKSTLLQAMMQLIPTSGDYTFLQRRVRGFKDVSAGAAYVFQNPEMQFVTNSVYEEAAFGFRRHGQPDVERLTQALLSDFGLADLKNQHPYQLSLGQKRRLSVATAMVSQERLVLLDEPTFGQDAANTFAILEKLEALRREGTTILMVTHDMEIVRWFATRVWLVERGELAMDADPGAYLRSAGLTRQPKREFVQPVV